MLLNTFLLPRFPLCSTRMRLKEQHMLNKYNINIRRSGDDNGGGFLLAWEDFGRMFDNSFPACAFFFFFLKRTHTN